MKKNRILIVLSCFFLMSFYVFAEPVDVVYTWVDGSDPAWCDIRNSWAKYYGLATLKKDANSKNRYRNRDELKYSLRSLVAYAPFVDHIYIVTFGQKPAWLKPHPRITIVDHSEIFKNRDDLPTFNSQAIEANLHHIKPMAEKFIYFNDDVLLNAAVKEEDFFYGTDSILVNISGNMSPTGVPDPSESSYYSAWKTTNAFLDATFYEEPRSTLSHAPFGLQKSLMYSLEQKFPDVFSAISSHKFRRASDFVMTNGFVQYCAFYEGKAQFIKQLSVILHLCSDVDTNKSRFKLLKDPKILFFCVQDGLKDDNEKVDKQLNAFFEKRFPDKAPWE